MPKLLTTFFTNVLAVSACLIFTLPNNVFANTSDYGIEVKGQASVLAVPDGFALSVAVVENGRLTVKVRTLEAGISGKILGVDFGYEIQINKHEIKERQRFTFAHEISHYLLHRDLIGEGISDTILYRSALSDSKEAEANRLAADILMPKFIVNQLINNNSDLPSVQQYECVAKELGVSVTALNIRMGK